MAHTRFEQLHRVVFVVAANSRLWDITFCGNTSSRLEFWGPDTISTGVLAHLTDRLLSK
jgi:hypothetical protein